MMHICDMRNSKLAPATIIVALLLCSLALACPHTSPTAHAAQPSLSATNGLHTHENPIKPQAKAVNANGKAGFRYVYRYGWFDGKLHPALRKTLTTCDVTGDAKRDSVTVIATKKKGTRGLASSLTVKVNGSVACTVKASEAGIDKASVEVLTLQNDEPFLYVNAYRANGSVTQALYRKSGKSFSKVFGNSLLQRTGTSNPHISHILPIGNRIVVQFEFVCTLTGHTRTSYTYAWKNDALVRTSNESLALRYVTRANGSYTRHARKAASSFRAYRDPSASGPGFTIAKGASVRPMSLRLSGKHLLFEVRSNGKTGWVKCPASAVASGGRLLKGTYGSVPLSHAKPAYTKKKRYSAAALQKLDNHALYLARNEIYARHGYRFSSNELMGYFSAKEWYEPIGKRKGAFNSVESANVNRIVAIERNRNSPYVS